MKIKKIKQNTLRFIGNFVLHFSISVLCKTMRISFVNKDVITKLENEGKNYILAFWHGTMLLPWYLNKNKKFAALISKSKDGELLNKILKRWKYNVIRGSSSVGGDVALGIMVDFAKNGYSVAITPDGPRGPAFKLKAGAVVTAKKSGLPLVLVGIGYKKKKFLRSWDSFQVPFFFTKANVVYSDQIFVDNNLTYEATSAIIKNCEKILCDLQETAEKFV
ncbi:MAG: lysophospholipid acyltransferase family protein [Ignavibacteriaceae bacterium]|nr:lysophospholipid acyltransferase family protein [Ignavibacteriaceae bacterium]